MKRAFIATLLSLSLSLSLSGPLVAAGSDNVSAKDPYVRAVPPGMANSAAFMQLNNGDKGDHALVAAESPVAQTVELHTHVQEGGMMMMRKIEKIDLPAGQTVALQPGGLHVMLIGLVKELKPGDQVELTLVYEDGSKSRVSAPVKMIQGMQMQHKAMQH
ncbi:MAG: copper chaperone PCu(A)C [Gammaproteobacteria bacterium]|nr:copper chaperone PCu(A)C [Gammaproteobacteria bacterium]MBU1656312.1 copper chaperone PCu(A)C [Gammaproteobacteria bacterium]MBU1959877.1 copper chaperone PCu(A)C [Gammaproteobacteria bacterium]